MQIILIEGVPGSGKSTLAKLLCQSARASGVEASWYPEESADHPIHPHSGKRTDKTPSYFLKQWRQFINTNSSKTHLFILEGSLFQSTVRFILEENRETEIKSYFKQCESLFAGVPITLLYLRPENIERHISWIIGHREAEWCGKVASYLKNTPFCLAQGWQENEIMHRFWSYYAAVCDELVAATDIPLRQVVSSTGRFEQQPYLVQGVTSSHLGGISEIKPL